MLYRFGKCCERVIHATPRLGDAERTMSLPNCRGIMRVSILTRHKIINGLFLFTPMAVTRLLTPDLTITDALVLNWEQEKSV